MKPERHYTIRQGVLKVAREYGQAPFGLEDLEADPSLERHNASRDEMLAAWRDLIGYGYLELIPAANGDLARITASGLAQINGDAKRDVAIWGRYAL